MGALAANVHLLAIDESLFVDVPKSERALNVVLRQALYLGMQLYQDLDVVENAKRAIMSRRKNKNAVLR